MSSRFQQWNSFRLTQLNLTSSGQTASIMKGIPGLIIAAALAIGGGICNWLYIAKQADRYERESFVVVRVDQIRAGEKFKKDDFAKVDIPKNNLGNLEKIAVRWQDVSTVSGQTAVKDFVRDQLILQDDLKTAPQENLNRKIGPDERVVWLPVDSRSFNSQHVNPGDMVSFRIPGGMSGATAVGTVDSTPMEEILGPFRILALGNRKGSPETARVAGQRFGSENVMAVSVRIEGTQLEKKAPRGCCLVMASRLFEPPRSVA
jgi:Flp pilus assembly protein CpaB